MTLYRNFHGTPVSLPSLKDRDEAVRRASHYPAGHLPRSAPREREDVDVALEHPTHHDAVNFRRTDRDNHRGRDNTDLIAATPHPRRPGQDATAEEIKAWNTFMAALPEHERDQYASASGIVRKLMKDGRR